MESAQELNFLTTLLPLALAVFVIALGVIVLNQHFRKNLYNQKLDQEKQKAQHQLELLKSAIEIQEAERKRIAADLHDELGAMLSMARMQLFQLEKQIPPDSTANLRQLVETALASTRRICYELMPPQLERLGLINTLHSLKEQVDASGKIYFNIEYNSDLPPLSSSTELSLYRIVSELVNNTIKHAQATEINLRMEFEESELICHYSDNGISFSREGINAGLGLKSIDARVGSLAGSFLILNQPMGFHAVLKIPFSK